MTLSASSMERLNELHEKYGLSKTREAEDMCNYSQYLVQKGKKEGREEGIEKGREEEKLAFLEKLEARHYSDSQIMEFLEVDETRLKILRKKLQGRLAVMADD